MIGKTRQAAGPARGVLKPMPEHGGCQHARLLAGEDLGEWVEHFWFVQWDLSGQAPQEQHTLPHPSVHWVVEPQGAGIYGIHTGRFTRRLEGCSRVFGIKFKPAGFRPFFGRAMSELQDARVAAREVFGEPALGFEAEVLQAEDAHAMADAAERFLLACRPAHDPNVDMLNRLVASIVHDRTITRVEQLAAGEGLELRSLQRLFRNYVGVGPKWVIQRYRLHEAVEQLKAGDAVDWADFAQALGYFDQAHFISEFRKLVGCTPAAYARGLLPA
jgi:AraC-like DNA-binding protein